MYLSVGRNMNTIISAVAKFIMFVSRVMKTMEVATFRNGGFPLNRCQLKLGAILLISGMMAVYCSAPKKITKPDAIPPIPPVQREFRAAWVATVANIDWPSKPGLSTVEQKNEAVRMLDTLARNNFNAVILQVRPQCDALYKSDLEPWSYYLTGEQGKAPEPYYDPLAFWVAEAHRRGLELHCWFNPYRAHHPSGGEVTDKSIVRTRPELARKVGEYWWLDPANKNTQDHSFRVIMDVVKRYDIDGVHMDDYFYPYGDGNFPDDDTWKGYKGKLSRYDWRRDNVNRFIHRLYTGIKKDRKSVV